MSTPQVVAYPPGGVHQVSIFDPPPVIEGALRLQNDLQTLARAVNRGFPAGFHALSTAAPLPSFIRYWPVSRPGRITRLLCMTDVPGAVTVDVQKLAQADYTGLASPGVSISGGPVQLLNGTVFVSDAVLAGWSLELAADDMLKWVVSGLSGGIQDLLVLLTVV